MNDLSNMNQDAEYAEQYTDDERKRLVLIGIGAGVVILIMWTMWGLPWIKWFSETAHCRTVMGQPATAALFYGVFVGLPLLVLLPCLGVAWTGVRILREQQVPPKNTKVLRPTKIIRGRSARIRGLLMLSLVPLSLLAAGWGYGEAGKLARQVNLEQPNTIACHSNKTFKARRWR
ncbi:MAG: hypothetical protein V4805_06925 [Pseudomonadota bacterium]